MGEEVKMSEYEANNNGGEEEDGRESNGEEERVLEWEMGLPTADDLTPLSQLLIPPELASAFSISPEPRRTLLDVNRHAQSTLSNLLHPNALSSSTAAAANNNNHFKPFYPDADGSESRKVRRVAADSEEAEADSAPSAAAEDQAGRTALKRPRLVWTPQLHKRFVDVVAHLGIKNAVPKTIMQLMNVEGLTRENVASHLQKYRLYLKRMNGGGGGLSCDDNNASSSDQLFASTPVPPGFQEAGAGPAHGTVPVPCHMPLPMYGHMPNNHHHQQQHQQFNQYHGNGFDGYGMMPVSYPHHNHQVAPNDHIH